MPLTNGIFSGGITGSGESPFTAIGREALERSTSRLFDEAGIGEDYQVSPGPITGGFQTSPVLVGDVGKGIPTDLSAQFRQDGGVPTSSNNQRGAQEAGFFDVNIGSGNFTLIVLAVLGFFVISELLE